MTSFASAGTYNDKQRPDRTSPCTACPEGRSTFLAGSVSINDCSICAAGYGGAECSQRCGGGRGANATFGAAGRSVGSDCAACPAALNAFSFFHRSSHSRFTPDVVSRVGAESSSNCLAEFAQIADAAWSMGGAIALNHVPDIRSFDDCVDSCKSSAGCQYVTYDYEATAGDGCFRKLAGVNATR